MKQKFVLLFISTFCILFLQPSFAVEAKAEKAAWNEWRAKVQMRDKEIRSQYKPVTNNDFSYTLERPLTGISLVGDFLLDKRRCFQPGIVVETQNGMITYISKAMDAKEVPCPKLPFEE